MKVTLVLDSAFGEALALLDPPIWVCDSLRNRAVVERLWGRSGYRPMDVTVITKLDASPEATCVGILHTIDEHHSDCTELVVVGVDATPAVRASFASFGSGQFLGIEHGQPVHRGATPAHVARIDDVARQDVRGTFR
jgi:hypothetical protein